MACEQGIGGLALGLPSSHFKDACGVGAYVHDTCRRLFQRCGSWQCLNRWRVIRLAKRQEESPHKLDSLLQGLAQLAIGCHQAHFLGQLRHRVLQRLLNAHRGPHINLGIGELGDDVVLPVRAAPGSKLAYELALLGRATKRAPGNTAGRARSCAPRACNETPSSCCACGHCSRTAPFLPPRPRRARRPSRPASWGTGAHSGR